MRIYYTTLDYKIDGNIIILQELKPRKPINYGLLQVVSNIAEVEKLKLSEIYILFNNKPGIWNKLEIDRSNPKLIPTNEKDYLSAKSKILGS